MTLIIILLCFAEIFASHKLSKRSLPSSADVWEALNEAKELLKHPTPPSSSAADGAEGVEEGLKNWSMQNGELYITLKGTAYFEAGRRVQVLPGASLYADGK